MTVLTMNGVRAPSLHERIATIHRTLKRLDDEIPELHRKAWPLYDVRPYNEDHPTLVEYRTAIGERLTAIRDLETLVYEAKRIERERREAERALTQLRQEIARAYFSNERQGVETELGKTVRGWGITPAEADAT